MNVSDNSCFPGNSAVRAGGIVLAHFSTGAHGTIATAGSKVEAMKQARSMVNQAPSADSPMDDESMAMVYVGDVYSLVVQEEATAKPTKKKDEKKRELPQDDDSLWPLIR